LNFQIYFDDDTTTSNSNFDFSPQRINAQRLAQQPQSRGTTSQRSSLAIASYAHSECNEFVGDRHQRAVVIGSHRSLDRLLQVFRNGVMRVVGRGNNRRQQ
jgi:hypothetical protein